MLAAEQQWRNVVSTSKKKLLGPVRDRGNQTDFRYEFLVFRTRAGDGTHSHIETLVSMCPRALLLHATFSLPLLSLAPPLSIVRKVTKGALEGDVT